MTSLQREDQERSRRLVDEMRTRVETELGGGVAQLSDLEQQLSAKADELLALSTKLQVRADS